MLPVAIIDFETRSAVDLKKCGVEVYVESETTEALCVAWVFGDEPTAGALLTGGAACPGPLAEHVRRGGMVVAHNARFELCLWRMLTKRHGPEAWPVLRIEQLICTMSLCRALALPGSLDKACEALRFGIGKDRAGHALMMKMCKPVKPRAPRKSKKAGADETRRQAVLELDETVDAGPAPLVWKEDPESLARLLAYCVGDVEAERQLFKTLPALNPDERKTWVLDQQINDRGVFLDLEIIPFALAATDAAKARLDAELYNLTGKTVKTTQSGAALLRWFASQKFPLDNLQKETVKAAAARAAKLDGRDVYLSHYAEQGGRWELVEDKDRGVWEAKAEAIRRAIEIRQEASLASTAKLSAMSNGAGRDWRARGLVEYWGASTGRWAGRRVQTQNMIRPPEDFDVSAAEEVFSWLRTKAEIRDTVLPLYHGSTMRAVSNSLRSLILAAPGNRLLCGDYANIEGRDLAWLAGEDWKIDAFREYDKILPGFDEKGEPLRAGPDLYKLAFSKAFGVPVHLVTKPQRQIGKVMELALGYQGAHGAFISMLKNYGIDLAKISAAVREAVSPGVWGDAVFQYWQGARETAEEMLAAERAEAANEGVDELPPSEAEILAATADAARIRRYDLSPDAWAAIRIIVDGWRAAHTATVWFWRGLEDGAIDAVANPGRVVKVGRVSYRVDGDFLMCRLPSGRCLGYPYPAVSEVAGRSNRPQKKLTFWGVSSKTRKWQEQKAYGGLLAENITQAVARDVLRDGMLRLDRSGYCITMHVHDEIVSEMPIGSGHIDEFTRLMSELEPWAAGMPIAVSEWEGRRYRK